jgi:hypothetical protein
MKRISADYRFSAVFVPLRHTMLLPFFPFFGEIEVKFRPVQFIQGKSSASFKFSSSRESSARFSYSIFKNEIISHMVTDSHLTKRFSRKGRGLSFGIG